MNNPRDLSQENEKLMNELKNIEKTLEQKEAECLQFDKENKKLKMLQSFNSVFNKTQTNKDSVLITQIIKQLEEIKAEISSEIKEIAKLRKEKMEFTKKITSIDQELSMIKPTSETTRMLTREKTAKEFSRFS